MTSATGTESAPHDAASDALWQQDTQPLHAGYRGREQQRSAAVPIYQSTSFVFDSAQHGANLFGLVEEGDVYSRTANPTLAVLEQRIATLEGGVAALALASGMAAIDVALATLARAGDHVVVASQLYGGTHNFIAHVLASRGVQSTAVAKDDFEALRRAIGPRTKAVFVESVGNPSGGIADLRRLADISHAAGVALVVDNTVASPLLLRPFDWGADIIVHSATKAIGGHGNVLGGLIVDSGRFDWVAHAGRYPQFSAPEPAYQGFVFTEKFPDRAFIARARAVLLLQGLETLGLRQERASRNTLAVIDFLQHHPLVERIHHASQPGHPDHVLARWQLRSEHVPALLGFELRGGRPAARAFYDALRLFLRLVNIGDSKSLAAIPAETTHSLLSDEELARVGIAPGLVRLSIGIEHPQDLLADLAQALERAATAVGQQHEHRQRLAA
jgi:O-acetylhomoserine (thiol)-lyase